MKAYLGDQHISQARIQIIDGDPVLLWTNPDTTVEFAAQTVTVDEKAGYIVELASSATSENPEFTYVFLNENENETVIARYGRSTTTSNLTAVYSRGITLLENNAIEFSVAYITMMSSGGPSPVNTILIPTRIWGVGFTLE